MTEFKTVELDVLRAAFQRSGLSYAEVAARSGVDRSNVRRIMTAQRHASVRLVARIGAAMDLDPVDLGI